MYHQHVNKKDIYLHFICLHCFAYFLLFIKIHDSLFYLKKSHFMVILYFSTTRISFFVHTLLLQNRFIGYVLLLQTLILKPQPFYIIRIPIEDFCISVETCFILIYEYCRVFNSENQQKSFSGSFCVFFSLML